MLVCVCLSVLYRNPNSWMDWDEILHGGGTQGGGRFLVFFYPVPPPPGMGCIKGVQGASGASTVRFDESFIIQKLLGTPDLVGFWSLSHAFG